MSKHWELLQTAKGQPWGADRIRSFSRIGNRARKWADCTSVYLFDLTITNSLSTRKTSSCWEDSLKRTLHFLGFKILLAEQTISQAQAGLSAPDGMGLEREEDLRHARISHHFTSTSLNICSSCA